MMVCPKCSGDMISWNKEWDLSIPCFFDLYMKGAEIYHCPPCRVLAIKDAEKVPTPSPLT